MGTVFTEAELAYLRSQQVGRLATLGPTGQPQIRPVGLHLGPNEVTIDVRGHALAQTQKWRNVARHPSVSFIVDTVVSLDPPRAHGIEVRGSVELLTDQGSDVEGLSGDVIRIHPHRVIAWGLDGAETLARTIS